MAIVAEFTIQSSSFPLGRISTEFPEAEFEAEEIRETTESLIIYIWIQTQTDPPTATAIEKSSLFQAVDRLDELENEYLYRAYVNEDQESVCLGISTNDVILESATSSGEEWEFRFRAESSDCLTRFQTYCRDKGFNARLTRFPTRLQIFNSQEYQVTDKQRDALVQAYLEGYFDTPRESTLEDIGESLGVTQQAVLARLRNGEKQLIGNTLVQSVNTDS